MELLAGEPEAVMMPTENEGGQKVSRCPAYRPVLGNTYSGFGDAIRFVRVRTLEDADQIPPDNHIHGASKQAWVALPEGARVVAGYHAREEVWGVESLARVRQLAG